MLILSPPNGFLSRSLFHNPPLSFGNEPTEPFSRFHEINFIPLRFVQHPGNVQPTGVCHRGMGKEESGGTGGENPEGEGGLQPGCPPFPGLSPQEVGRTVLRRKSTQIIKDKPGKDGHSKAEHSCVSGARRKNKTRHKQMVTERQRAQKQEPFGSRHTSYVRRISSAISRLGSRISIACRSMYL